MGDSWVGRVYQGWMPPYGQVVAFVYGEDMWWLDRLVMNQAHVVVVAEFGDVFKLKIGKSYVAESGWRRVT